MTTEQFDYSNPYVGPYAFTAADKLHGREREVRELLDLLVADRIVLLHSPSGAGKTSIIHAALVPALREDGFHVLKVVRVGVLSPIQDSNEHNRYVLSTLLSLEEDLPADQQLPDEELTGISLKDYLGRLFNSNEQEAVVLIFDQFEEILTLDPVDDAEKKEFFRQLGEALKERRLWALFAMREDFIGALDPYLGHIPTRLVNTYRLDLLGVQAALAATQKPAQERQVTFLDDAAQILVDDLRKVHVQRLGKTVEELGLHIEPVQLQVVCHRLWTKLAEDWKQQNSSKPAITKADVEGCANVNQALAGYFADKVREIAQGFAGRVQERDLRDWFENNLISDQGIRGQVLQGEGETQGLDNAIIEGLINAYLVREERRRGVTWFELAHDRLIEPIRQDNSAWREANLSPFQIQAITWRKSNEDQNFLPTGPALDEAVRWFAQYQGKLTPIEQRFRDACRVSRDKLEQYEREVRLRRKERVFKARLKKKEIRSSRGRRMAFGIATGSLAFAAIAAIGWVSAYRAKNMADLQARIISARQISAEATNNLDSNPERSMFLGLLAVGETYPVEGEDRTKDALSLALNDSQVRHTLINKAPVSDLTFAPDGNRLLTVGPEGMSVWDAVAGRPIDDKRCTAVGGRLRALAYERDGKSFAVVSESGDGDSIKFVDGDTCAQISQIGIDPNKRINAIAVGSDNPDRKLLATGNSDGTSQLFDIQSGRELQTFNKHTEAINALAFSPDGKFLVTASDDSTAIVWRIADGKDKLLKLPADLKGVAFKRDGKHPAKVTGVAFSSDGKFLVTTSGNIGIVWDAKSWTASLPLIRHTGTVNAVAFSPNREKGEFVATVSEDKTLIVWNAATGDSFATVYGHELGIKRVAFSPDGKYLASASEDGTVKIWQPSRTVNSVEDVAISGDGKHIASLSRDGIVSVRDMDSVQQSTLSIKEVGRVGGGYTGKTEEAFQEPFRRIVFVPDVPGNLTIVSRDRATPWRADQPTPFPFKHPGITCVAYSKNGPSGRTIAATGNSTGEIKFWDPKSAGGFFREKRDTINPHRKSINAIAFSPDGKYLATASNDGTAKLINVDTGLTSRTFPPVNYEEQARDKILALDFSPDGKLLATAGADKLVRVWDVETGSLWCRPFTGHSAPINTLAFIPLSSGLLLATGGDDKKTRVWDVSARKQEKTEVSSKERTYMEGESGNIRALAMSLSSDKQFARLVTGTELGRLRVHLLGKGGFDQLLTQARRRATRTWLRDVDCPEDFLEQCHKAQAGLQLIIDGNELARAGFVTEAVAKYQEANRQGYAALKVEEPEKEAEELSDEGHQERGQNYARSGNWEKAVGEYQQLILWKNLFDAGQTLVSRGYYKKPDGQEMRLVDVAIDLYRRAEKGYDQASNRDPSDPAAHAAYDNYLCWYGSWWGNYRPEIEKACDDAVKLSNDSANLDSQGVFFALAWQCTHNEEYRTKAIANFKSYADSTDVPEEKVYRADWIRRLQNNDTIFAPEILDKWIGPLTPEQLDWTKHACDRRTP